MVNNLDTYTMKRFIHTATAFELDIKAVIIFLFMSCSIPATAQCTAMAYFITSIPQNNGTVYLQDSSTYTGQYIHFTVDWGDGQTNTGNLNIFAGSHHTYISPGTYFLCYTISDSLNPSCTDTFCDSVTISTSSAACDGYFMVNDSMGSYYFHSTVNGVATNFAWDFGDGTSSGLEQPGFHTFTTSGVHIICFTASNPNTACSFTYCDTVFISECTATFSYSNGSLSGEVNFSSNIISSSADTYLWDFGDGSTATLANPSHTYVSNGTYNVCLTVSSGTDSTCFYNTCLLINVNTVTLCDPNFTIIQDSVTASHFWVFNTSNNNFNTSFHWDFGDGDTSNLQYPLHNYSTPGPYLLCLTVSANNGSCSNTFCDTLQAVFKGVSPLSISVIPSGTLETPEQINGMLNLIIYPNPIQDIANIHYSISNPSNVELVVTDLLGNIVTSLANGNKPSGEYSAELRVEGIANGLYLLRLKTNERELIKRVIIAQ